MFQYLDDFVAGLESRFTDDKSTMSMSEWMIANTHLRKKPFSFKGFEFQKQIADDMHHDLCVIKCSQIGLTEIQLRKYLGFLKRNTAVTGIFTLPKDTMRDRVSQTRVKPLIDEQPVFNQHPAHSKPVRHKGLYQIDQSFAYFTGSTEGDATSIPADILFNDEIDLTDQAMLGLFQSRLQGSKYRITQAFSTPTYIGFGVDGKFNVSDQHLYMYRCPKCRHYQEPDFHPRFLCLPGNTVDTEDLTLLDADQISKINFDEAHLRCEKCSAPIDLDPSNWSWVATFPTRRSRGYRVRPFSIPTIQLPYIFDQLTRYKAASNLRGFYNTVLGQPFNDSNARLQETDIRAIMESPQPYTASDDEQCFIGIDVGITCHLVIGKPGLVFHWEQVPSHNLLNRVSQLASQYNIVGGCIDLEPYRPTAEDLRDMTSQIILPVDYSTTNGVPAITNKTDEFGGLSHLVANRTMAIDSVARAVRKAQVKFTGYGHLDRQIIQHLMDMVRIEEPDQDAKWEKLNGNDHFFHALAYLFVAMRNKQVLDFSSDNEHRMHSFMLAANITNYPKKSVYAVR